MTALGFLKENYLRKVNERKSLENDWNDNKGKAGFIIIYYLRKETQFSSTYVHVIQYFNWTLRSASIEELRW